MFIFKIVYFIIGFPFFLFVNILSSIFMAIIQSIISYKYSKLPWEVKIEDTDKFIRGFFSDEE